MYAGQNEIYRYGNKAQEKVRECLTPNENGFYSISTYGGKYWSFGTSKGQYGEYAKYKDTIFSVNKNGFIWAKVGTPKAAAFVEMLNDMINHMQQTKEEQEAYRESKRLEED